MRWPNLKNGCCPKCDNRLTQTANGLECTHVDGYYQTKCIYFITNDRLKELLEKMKSTKAPPIK